MVWKNIILSIPNDYKIIITSDHGYVYLNNGFASGLSGEAALSFLQQERFRYFYHDENPPQNFSEFRLFSNRSLVMIKGRIKNSPNGHSSNKVFSHGGLSFMEMLVPWFVIKRY